jgi:hypothetical protein
MFENSSERRILTYKEKNLVYLYTSELQNMERRMVGLLVNN